MIEGIKIQGIKAPFARGVVMDRGIHYLPHSLTPQARNIRLRNGTTVRRNGYVKIAKGESDHPIDNLISTWDKLYAISGQQLYEVDFQKVNLIKKSNTKFGKNVNLLRYGSFIILLNGETSGCSYNITNGEIKNLAIDEGANPRLWEVFEQNIYLAWSGDKSNILYKSRAWRKNEPENILDFKGNGSEELSFRSKITGMVGTREQLFIRTEDTIEIIQQSEIWGIRNLISVPIAGMNEPANPKMVVKADDRVFFWTKENMMKSLNYVQWVSETSVGDVSHREGLSIKDFIEALDEDQSTSFGYYNRKNKTVHWHLKPKWEPYTTVVLVYDLDKDTFLVDTNKYFTCVVNHKIWYYAWSANEQVVYQDERGNADDGQAIQWERRTPKLSLGSPTTRKEWRQVSIYGEKQWDVEIFVDVVVEGKIVCVSKIEAKKQQISGFTSMPTATVPLARESWEWGISPFEFTITRGNLRARGKDIQIVLKGTSWWDFCLTGLEIGYKELYEWDKTDRARPRQ